MKPPSETDLLRKKVRELHREKPFSRSVLQSAGLDPDNVSHSFLNPRKGVCEWLVANHGVEDATLYTPPAPEVNPLAAYGPLGDAITGAITSALDSLPAPAIDESEVDGRIARAIAALPPVPAIDETTIEASIRRVLSALPKPERAAVDAFAARAISSDEDQPYNLRILARYCYPGAAKKPVSFQGEPGSSKTWAARRWGSKFDPANVFDISCHAGTTCREFLGAYVPFSDGFVKCYGKLAKAFQAAISAPTLLIVDERNRLPVELSSVFCGALNRQLRGGVEHYVLDTGLPDGTGGTEEIACPCKNLSIVSTCNEGPGYNVNADDRAEMQRWVAVRVSFNEADVSKIIATVIFDKWTIADAALVEPLVKFLTSAREMALVNHQLQTAPTVRCVVDAVHAADTIADVPEILWQLAVGWYAALSRTTGTIEHQHLVTLQACFSAAGLTLPANA